MSEKAKELTETEYLINTFRECNSYLDSQKILMDSILTSNVETKQLLEYMLQDDYISEKYSGQLKKISGFCNVQMIEALAIKQTVYESTQIQGYDNNNNNQEFTFETMQIESLKNMYNADYLKFNKLEKLSDTLRLQLHDTLTIGARTGVGKSTLALNLLSKIDNKDKYHVLYFNLEMDMMTVFKRFTAITNDIEVNEIDMNNYNEYSYPNNITIINNMYFIEDIIYKVEQYEKQYPNKIIIVCIDHILLTRSKKDNKSSRYEIFTNISQDLHKFINAHRTININVCQMTKADGKIKGYENESFKESGSIPNDSTHIIFFYENEEENEKDKKDINYTIKVTKNRCGAINKYINTTFEKEKQIITEKESLKDYIENKLDTEISELPKKTRRRK